MLKLIVPPPQPLTLRMAWRNEPVPVAFVLMTVWVQALGAANSERFCVTDPNKATKIAIKAVKKATALHKFGLDIITAFLCDRFGSGIQCLPK